MNNLELIQESSINDSVGLPYDRLNIPDINTNIYFPTDICEKYGVIYSNNCEVNTFDNFADCMDFVCELIRGK